MSLCETSLNDGVEIPEPLIDDYNFVPMNHPSGNRRGGVGIFYKEKLSLEIRKNLSFNECLASEVLIGKRKVFYSVCYRSPSMKTSTPGVETFLADFENLYTNISKNKRCACFFAGDFNAHSLCWWPNGDTNAKGLALDNLLTTLDLSQLIKITNLLPVLT